MMKKAILVFFLVLLAFCVLGQQKPISIKRHVPVTVETPSTVFGVNIESGTVIFSVIDSVIYVIKRDFSAESTINTMLAIPGSYTKFSTGATAILPYKVFTGYINQQSESDPVVVSELENTIGNISWTWDGSHLVLNAILTGAFTAGKTVALAIDPVEGFKGAGMSEYAPDRLTWELSGYSGSITNLFVEIRVYQ